MIPAPSALKAIEDLMTEIGNLPETCLRTASGAVRRARKGAAR